MYYTLKQSFFHTTLSIANRRKLCKSDRVFNSLFNLRFLISLLKTLRRLVHGAPNLPLNKNLFSSANRENFKDKYAGASSSYRKTCPSIFQREVCTRSVSGLVLQRLYSCLFVIYPFGHFIPIISLRWLRCVASRCSNT